MHRSCSALLFFVLALAGAGLAQQVARPYETAVWSTPANGVDARVEAALKGRGLGLRSPCSDEVFIRRVYIDLIGALPTADEAQAFLQDRRPDKRAALIETLFTRDEFADYWSMKWCDLLRVKSEFPSNLWPNAVQAYHRWIHTAVRDNMPYDQFTRALLTSSGSNFREAPVNFYRAVPARDPASLAKTVALTFMGTRLERWPEARQKEMAAFFSRVAYKKTGEWKEEIVYLNPAAEGPLQATLPDGTAVTVPVGADPRDAFADWLLKPGNPWFARNIVNRMWAWTMGRGVIHEADDIRPDNPAACPELLAYLEGELANSKYDLRQVFRVILNSRTYQQSSLPHGDEQAGAEFARYTVRRLDAEVLIDALDRLGGTGESYSSPIPEPFTFIPGEQRTIALADGSISSPFLAMFGRPSRDTGLESERDNEPSDAQRLYLLNSTDIQQRIKKSPQLLKLAQGARQNRGKLLPGIYLAILSRYPTPEEAAVAAKYVQTPGLQPRQAIGDLAWALVNSSEFLYRH